MPQTAIRKSGASARLPPGGQTEVASATGGELTVSQHMIRPGFSPVDLLYAALASCIVISARQAAQKLGVLEQLGEVRANVTGDKATEGPNRVERFHVKVEIDGPLDVATKRRIAEAAEFELCTVGNTLRGSPAFVLAD